ncbi:MAG TPA: SDR family oxidoreductase [Asanoa sp.]
MVVAVTGAGGLLGRAVSEAFGGSAQALTHADVDVTSPASVERVLADGEVELCVHCAADPDIAACERDPARARALNTDGARIVAEACARHGVRLVHVSSDYVFDGALSRPYRETDPVSPLQVYGRTKADAELTVRAAADALVVRLPLLYGGGPGARTTFPDTVVDAIRSGRPLDADARETRQPALVADVADRIRALARRSDVTGIVHVAPDDTVTKADWARRIAVMLGADPAFVRPTYEVPAVPRPVRSTLDNSRLKALGIAPPRSYAVATAHYLSGR